MSAEKKSDFSTYSQRIRSILKTGVLNDAPPTPFWRRNKAILRSWLNTDLSYAEIAAKHKVSETRARQIANSTAHQLLIAEGKYPDLIEDSPFCLPQRPLGERLLIRQSESGGGKLKMVAELARDGVDPKTIVAQSGISSQDLVRHRQILAISEVSIPYIREPVNLDSVKQALSSAYDYEGDLKAVLSRLTISNCLNLKREGSLPLYWKLCEY